MKFKGDENLPVEIAELLIDAGYDAKTVNQQQLKGIADPSLAEICAQEGRVLVTLDLDFADIWTYPPKKFPGFIVMRVGRQDKKTPPQSLQKDCSCHQSRNSEASSMDC